MTLVTVRSDLSMSRARRAMVDNQIRTFDVTDQRVLEVFELIPREKFLPPDYADLAYSDAALTVKGTDTTRRAILVPMVLARMIQGLQPDATHRALVVAAGTGYAAAILAQLTASVIALEADAAFVEAIKANAADLGLGNLETIQGGLDAGSPAHGPFDLILVCGAVECGFEVLLKQLAPGGRMVAIQTETHEATRRSGKVTRYDVTDAEVSSRVLFDATAPVLEAFRQPPAFVF